MFCPPKNWHNRYVALHLLSEQNWTRGKAGAVSTWLGCSVKQVEDPVSGFDVSVKEGITLSDFIVANRAHLFAGE